MKTNKLLQKRLVDRIVLSANIPVEFDNCAGNLETAEFVLVGERPANESKNERYYPFCDIAGCSGWLNLLLDKEKIPEEKLFWINAVHLDGSQNDHTLLDLLEGRQIICLGRVAERWVKQAGKKYVQVPHPQYWKRFKSKEKYPLLELLK